MRYTTQAREKESISVELLREAVRLERWKVLREVLVAISVVKVTDYNSNSYTSNPIAGADVLHKVKSIINKIGADYDNQ